MFSQTKVHADGFRMANVQIAIGFWRKASHDFIVLTLCQIILNDGGEKIGRLVTHVNEHSRVGRVNSGRVARSNPKAGIIAGSLLAGKASGENRL